MSPLLYILYTADIPDLVHEHPVSITKPSTYCQPCGSTVAYMDDCTYSVGCQSATELTEKLNKQYEIISDYMAANKLVINDNKLHLVVFCKKNMEEERKHVFIKAGAYKVTPTKTEKLLGAFVCQSLKWTEHIFNNENSL